MAYIFYSKHQNQFAEAISSLAQIRFARVYEISSVIECFCTISNVKRWKIQLRTIWTSRRVEKKCHSDKIVPTWVGGNWLNADMSFGLMCSLCSAMILCCYPRVSEFSTWKITHHFNLKHLETMKIPLDQIRADQPNACKCWSSKLFTEGEREWKNKCTHHTIKPLKRRTAINIISSLE